MTNPCASSTCDLLIVGGGLAGLAAAEAASRAGLRVELVEHSPRLGGRTGSFVEPGTEQCVDVCQHVAMGCCHQWLDFCRRIGADDGLRRYKRLNFIAPGGALHQFIPAWWLPAPLHLAPGLMRLQYLSVADRLRIMKALVQLVRRPPGDDRPPTIGPWLRVHGQTAAGMAGFWEPILVSALSAPLERIAVSAARQVFRDGFLGSRHAYELIVPQTPLAELFDRRAGSVLEQRGVVIQRGVGVRVLQGGPERVEAAVLTDGRRIAARRFLLAVPWRSVYRLIPPAMQPALPELQNIAGLPVAPITAVHLWFDRDLTWLPHAALLGRVSQWLFRGPAPGPVSIHGVAAYYYQVVISGAHEFLERERVDLLAQVCQELAAIFPQSRHARVLAWRVVTRRAAVFTLEPGVDALRPPQTTRIANLFLAGDWTRTGWPSTMEGAVRSGYLAVEAMGAR